MEAKQKISKYPKVHQTPETMATIWSSQIGATRKATCSKTEGGGGTVGGSQKRKEREKKKKKERKKEQEWDRQSCSTDGRVTSDFPDTRPEVKGPPNATQPLRLGFLPSFVFFIFCFFCSLLNASRFSFPHLRPWIVLRYFSNESSFLFHGITKNLCLLVGGCFF